MSNTPINPPQNISSSFPASAEPLPPAVQLYDAQYAACKLHPRAEACSTKGQLTSQTLPNSLKSLGEQKKEEGKLTNPPN
jgi:hypothetical protein